MSIAVDCDPPPAVHWRRAAILVLAVLALAVLARLEAVKHPDASPAADAYTDQDYLGADPPPGTAIEFRDP